MLLRISFFVKIRNDILLRITSIDGFLSSKNARLITQAEELLLWEIVVLESTI